MKDMAKFFEQMIYNSPSAVFAISNDGKIIYANSSGNKLIWSEEMPCYFALYRKDSECLDCPLVSGRDFNLVKDHITLNNDGKTVAYERIISPIYNDGKIVGVIETLHEIEKQPLTQNTIDDNDIKENVEGEMKDVLISIIPVLTKMVSPEDRHMVIKDIGDRFEAQIETRLYKCEDSFSTLSCVCGLMNEIGGNFSFDKKDDHIEVFNTVCPWGNEAINNPFLCNITRMIFSRALNKHGMDVVLLESIGNRDSRCLLRSYKKS